MLQNDIQTAAPISQGVAGGAEVQEFDLAVGHDTDIVRGHVPVDDAPSVDGIQGLHNRCQQLKGFLPGQTASAVRHILIQTPALNVLHHEIGRIVFFKIVVDSHDIGIALKGRQRPGLLQETLLAVDEIIFSGAGVGRDGAGAVSGCHGVGKIFLDCHPFLGLIILRQIGDAEAALTQYPTQNIPTSQNGTYWQS